MSEAISAILLVLGGMFLAAFGGGIILWLIWPEVMVAVFHLPSLTLWQSICLCWIANILIKTTTTVKNER